MVRAADTECGHITCSHVGCGAINILQTMWHYDQSLALSLNAYGQLAYLNDPVPGTLLPLHFGNNVLGTDSTCQIRIDRYQHEGQCYISRHHCTLTVSFDKWLGTLRYQLRDGRFDPNNKTIKASLNGTSINGIALHPTEQIDVADGDIITLGGIDRFRLSHQLIDSIMRETYKVDIAHNFDQTQ